MGLASTRGKEERVVSSGSKATTSQAFDPNDQYEKFVSLVVMHAKERPAVSPSEHRQSNNAT